MAEKTYSYYENLLDNPRVQAALNTVSWSDGVLDHPGVKDPYGTRYGYSTFDYSGWHPNDTISKGRYTSSAVGKYQAMRYSFAPLAAELGIPNINAKNQDVFALALIDQVPGALDAALKGDARTFADKTKGLWTSLPGGSQSKSKGKGEQAVERHRQQVEKAFNAYLDKATKNPSTLGGLSMNSAAKQRAEAGTGFVERRSPTEQAQTQLTGLGFQPGAINGVYGNWTGRTSTRSGRPQLNEPLRAAIGAFQDQYGLPFTQQLDQSTLDALATQTKAQDARDARLGALPSAQQQSMVRPSGPIGNLPRNPLFPDKVAVPTQRPNIAPPVNPAEIQRMKDNLANKMAFARPNPSNMNVSGYGFSTPAKPSGPQVSGSATGSIGRASASGSLAVSSRNPSVMGGRGNINPPNVVAAPANVLSNFDENGRFTGTRASPITGSGISLSSVTNFAPGPASRSPGPSAPAISMDSVARQAQNATRQSTQRETWKDVAARPASPVERLKEAARPMAPAGTPANMGAAGYGLQQFDPIDIAGSAMGRPQPTMTSRPSNVIGPGTGIPMALDRAAFGPVPATVARPTASMPGPTMAASGRLAAINQGTYNLPAGRMTAPSPAPQPAAPLQQRVAPAPVVTQPQRQITNEPQSGGRTPGDRARDGRFQPGGIFGYTSQAARGGGGYNPTPV